MEKKGNYFIAKSENLCKFPIFDTTGVMQAP